MAESLVIRWKEEKADQRGPQLLTGNIEFVCFIMRIQEKDGHRGIIFTQIIDFFIWFTVTHFSMETPKMVIGKQCRPRSECSVWSGLPLFAYSLAIFL